MFENIPGFSPWVRKDRENRTGGGVTICFKNGLQTQELEIVLPHLTEELFFRVVLAESSGLLLCHVLPHRQGSSPLDFLMEELDTILLRHKCSHVMVVGNLNFHLEQEAFNNLLMVQGLVNHVTFPTHEREGLLDPILSDLPETNIVLQPLGASLGLRLLCSPGSGSAEHDEGRRCSAYHLTLKQSGLAFHEVYVTPY